MLKNVLTVMLGTFSSRVFGLLRQAVFNALFPDALKDAFNVAYRVPNLLRELLAEGAVQNALIPVLKGLSEEEARRFSRRFGAFLLGINLMALGLGYLFAPQIALLLVAPGSHLREAESFQQVVFLIRLLLPFLLISDPSSRTAWFHPAPKPIPGLQFFLPGLKKPLFFTWPTWEKPGYALRLKPLYYTLRNAWKEGRAPEPR